MNRGWILAMTLIVMLLCEGGACSNFFNRLIRIEGRVEDVGEGNGEGPFVLELHSSNKYCLELPQDKGKELVL